MSYLPFVDGLRALAIFAVVGYHAMPAVIPGGFAGVDVFFVISGFLITRFVANEIAENRFSFARFFVRRARRLLPAALFCFLAVAVLSAFVLYPDAYWYFGRSLLGAVLMYANFFFENTGGYFSAPSLEKPLLHTWSLAVEDQFYLTWPLLLWMLRPRLPVKVVIGVTVTILAVSLIHAETRTAVDPEYAFFMLPARAWELLTGGALALAIPFIAIPRGVREILAGAGVAAIAMSCWLLSPEGHFPGFGAVPACAGTAAIIAASLHQPTLVSRFLALRPMVFAGLHLIFALPMALAVDLTCELQPRTSALCRRSGCGGGAECRDGGCLMVVGSSGLGDRCTRRMGPRHLRGRICVSLPVRSPEWRCLRVSHWL